MVFSTIHLQIQSTSFEWIDDKILFKPVSKFRNPLDYKIPWSRAHISCFSGLMYNWSKPFILRFVPDHVGCLKILGASPEIKISSVFIFFQNFLTLFVMWVSKVPKQINVFQRKKFLIPVWKISKKRSSFIQAFEHDATTHRFLNSSFSAVPSCLAPWKTIKGFNFVPSAFVVKHTLTLSFSFPVDLRGFVPVLSTVHFQPCHTKWKFRSLQLYNLVRGLFSWTAFGHI